MVYTERDFVFQVSGSSADSGCTCLSTIGGIVISALPNSRFDPCTPDKENSARDFAPGQEAKGIGVLLSSDLQRTPDNH